MWLNGMKSRSAGCLFSIAWRDLGSMGIALVGKTIHGAWVDRNTMECRVESLEKLSPWWHHLSNWIKTYLMPTFTYISNKVPCMFKPTHVRFSISSDHKGNENSHWQMRCRGSRDSSHHLSEKIQGLCFPKSSFTPKFSQNGSHPFLPR